MIKPLLSIMMPAIRPHNWVNLYKSIQESLESNDFELIFVAPCMVPEELEYVPNIKLIKDFGSPNRAFQLAMNLVEGQYVTWGADDGTYVPGQLKKVIQYHKDNYNDKLVIAMEQVEAGRHYAATNCYINQHEPIASEHIPDTYVFFPTGLMTTKFYINTLGGIDCELFETHAMAHLDLAIRAQKANCIVHFHKEIVLSLTHMMGDSGDHGPIYRAQTFRDEPAFRSLYRSPNGFKSRMIKMNDLNWVTRPRLWQERFSTNKS